MWLGGWAQYQPGPRDEGRRLVVKVGKQIVEYPQGQALEVMRSEIPSYFTEEAVSAIRLWERWKLMGLPFAGGWADQPAVIVDVIEMCEGALRRVQGAGTR